MRTAPGALVAFLNAGSQALMADLYTVTLVSGTVYRWTSADTDLTYGGSTYLAAPNAPILARGSTRLVRGLEVDALRLTLGGGAGGFLIGGVTIPLAVANGVLDDATVQLDRLFMAYWGDTTLGTVNLFTGSVAGSTPTSTGATLDVKSDLQKLAVQLPRNLYMPTCAHLLFDSGCGLARATYTATATVTGSPTVSSVPTSLAAAADYYKGGVMIGVTGANAGVRRGIVTNTGPTSAVFAPAVPWPVAPSAGDTFAVTAGCDKALATCTSKFSNAARFRGFPFIPKPEVAR